MNKQEILWNIINSVLAGGLVFLGALSDGNISINGFVTAFIAAGIVAVSKFKDYWKSQEKEYKVNYMFDFI